MKGVIIKSLLFIIFSNSVFGQDLPQTLNAEQVLQIVRNFHPIVRQANIGIEKSQAEILNARGNFDPFLIYYFGQKKFNNVDYYTDNSPELNIPTWYGVDLFAGIENLSGSRLDPTQTFGKSSYLGLNIPLLKNLIFDKRRAYLQQAKVYNSISKAEQHLMINDLCMEAITAYWEWVKAYQIYKVVESNVIINERRLNLIRRTIEGGERPAIDSIEAITQLQSFQYAKNESWLAFQNAGLQLSTFMWTKENEPYNLPESVVPDENWANEVILKNYTVSLTDLLFEANNNHPFLNIYKYKLEVLKIEKKLKFQELLPRVDLRYSFLAKDYYLQRAIDQPSLFQDNYQMGLKVEVPLFFSQGRANYKTAKLKIEDTRLEQNQKQLAIQLKVKAYFNEYINLTNQLSLLIQNVNNYLQLVKAEETRFANGESSLFLINSRENKALEAQEKLIEVRANYFKSIYAMQWSAGLLK